jgi:hypothetical protein
MKTSEAEEEKGFDVEFVRVLGCLLALDMISAFQL